MRNSLGAEPKALAVSPPAPEDVVASRNVGGKVRGAQLVGRYIDTRTGRLVSGGTEGLIDALVSRGSVIYFGENHDDFSHHQAQADLILALHRRYPSLTVALEFLYRADQPLVDRFVAGEPMGQEEVRQLDAGFGRQLPLYRPLLAQLRRERINTLALNVRTEVKHTLVEHGWAALTPDERKTVAADLELDDPRYAEAIRALFAGMGAGNWPPRKMERMIALQAVWDASFADAIAQHTAKQSLPSASPTFVIAGANHVARHYATPERAFARQPVPFVTIMPAWVAPDDLVDVSALAEANEADFVFVAEQPSLTNEAQPRV